MIPDPIVSHVQEFLGIKLSVWQGSASGGLTAALVTRGAFWRRLVNGVVGALAAIHMTPLADALVRRFLDTGPEGERALAFAMGVVGMVICESLLTAAERVRHRTPALVDRALDKPSAIPPAPSGDAP